MSTSPRPDLDGLAQHLSAMPLATAAVPRDQLFFRAGQAQGQAQQRRLFTLAAAVLTCLGLGAGLFLGRWSAPVVEVPVVVQPLVLPLPAKLEPKPQPEQRPAELPKIDSDAPKPLTSSHGADESLA